MSREIEQGDIDKLKEIERQLHQLKEKYMDSRQGGRFLIRKEGKLSAAFIKAADCISNLVGEVMEEAINPITITGKTGRKYTVTNLPKGGRRRARRSTRRRL
jgi:hypothetical protein